MKKFVLSIFLLVSILWGHSQVILNELFTDPSTGSNKQFFELYNAGNTPIQLDCYTIVSNFSFVVKEQGKNVTHTGFYVIDLPAFEIQPRSYFVGAAGGGVINTGTVPYTPDLNWNAGSANLALVGASFMIYDKVASNTYRVNDTTGIDFLASNGNKYAVFLFNNSTYINGFITAGTSAVSNVFTGMPVMTNITNSCGPYSIDWSNVTNAEFNSAATGSSHGYYRGANGLCGTWTKITGNNENASKIVTPKRANPKVISAVQNSGTINSLQAITCGEDATKSAVSFRISSVNDQSIFPITVELYYDNKPLDSLDNGDQLHPTIKTITSTTSLPYADTFSIPTGQKTLIVYRTALGCISQIIAPSSTATLVTNQYNICNQQAAFSITNADALTSTYGFPVTVKFMYDGAPLGDAITITEPSPTIYYSNTFTDPTKLSIQYTPANCLSASTVSNATTSSFTLVSGSLTTEQKTISQASSIYPIIVSANVTDVASSVSPYSSSVFPVEARLYIDNDPSNQTPDTSAALYPESYLGSVTFNGTNDGAKMFAHEFTANDQGKTIYIVYQPNLSCFGSIKSIILPEASILPVTFTSFTASRKDKNVALRWETATEENNLGFQVQRNSDGTWKDIAFVFSAADNGNSTAPLTYAFTDVNTAKGISQYRILQVDKDGKGRYSEIRSVRGDAQTIKGLVVFPNPSTDKVTLLFEEVATPKDVIVSDMTGRIVKQYRNVSDNSLVIENLHGGVYAIQVTDRYSGVRTTERVVIKKR